ncbi:Ldh family oxidoreductase [Anaerotruncus rubiinfantis]|uniref:Ldh family oxidoreductase n=1 Tax=Anaerotruncus rubiinfantis TaxID=1720200 RepID=UPI00189AE815|nr:Ldh family oxidoreductase [Anaerotruncus rubiinfantis]
MLEARNCSPYQFTEDKRSENEKLPASVHEKALKAWCSEILVRVGMSKADADVMAYILVETDLMGVDTHGILKFPMYVSRAQKGGDNPKAKLRVLKDTPTTALCDGEGGYGQVMGWRAMELAVEKANQTGVGFVSVGNSNTLTACRLYSRLAAENGCIGICITNGTPQMPPPGGRQRLLGTSPWSFAVPGKKFPVMFDMACTVVGWTKMAMMLSRGEKMIPGDWAVTADGKPTTDLVEGMNGLMLPFGGHKGYALSCMAELLTGVLSGGRVADELGYYGNHEENTGISHLLGAIKIDSFLPLDEFESRVDKYVRHLKDCPRTEDAGEIYVPGERSFLTAEKRRAEGIPLHPSLARNLVAVGEEMSIPFPGSK